MGVNAWRFAATYDRFSAATEQGGLAAHRADLLADARGRTLEIGGGTGANLAHYGPAVDALTVTEPHPAMVKRLERKLVGREHADPPVMVLRAPAEDLPFPDATFDTVVSTLVLCSVDDQPRALRELRRVLRPDGRLLFMEHVRSDDPGLARRQDRMNWLNRIVVLCDCNRPTLRSIEAAGFTLTHLTRSTLPKAPSFASPLVVGIATPPGPTPAETPGSVTHRAGG
jgi:ubiquinone/menaquinone biosynthesis C-methylase UbiE